MDHIKGKFNCNIKNTRRRLPVRSLYYSMDPQGRKTNNGKNKPHQQKSQIYKWTKFCLRPSRKTLSTKQHKWPTNSVWGIYKSNNINTRSTCSSDHKEKNKETTKIMVWQGCTKIEKTKKNGRKNLAKTKNDSDKEHYLHLDKSLQDTSIPQLEVTHNQLTG